MIEAQQIPHTENLGKAKKFITEAPNCWQSELRE